MEIVFHCLVLASGDDGKSGGGDVFFFILSGGPCIRGHHLSAEFQSGVFESGEKKFENGFVRFMLGIDNPAQGLCIGSLREFFLEMIPKLVEIFGHFFCERVHSSFSLYSFSIYVALESPVSKIPTDLTRTSGSNRRT